MTSPVQGAHEKSLYHTQTSMQTIAEITVLKLQDQTVPIIGTMKDNGKLTDNKWEGITHKDVGTEIFPIILQTSFQHRDPIIHHLHQIFIILSKIETSGTCHTVGTLLLQTTTLTLMQGKQGLRANSLK